MAKVKCAYCGKSIDKKEAYIVPVSSKRNKYYCSYEHSISKKPRDKMYDLIYEVFGRKVLNTVLFKECDEIGKVHTYEKVTAYIEENKQYLEQIMSKGFSSEYAQIRYFSAVLKNSLTDFQPKQSAPVVKKDVNFDMDVTVNNYKRKEQRKGMDDILADLLED